MLVSFIYQSITSFNAEKTLTLQRRDGGYHIDVFPTFASACQAIYSTCLRRPFGSWSRGKRGLDAKVQLDPWDHTRSIATGTAEIGVAPHIVVLNHLAAIEAEFAAITGSIAMLIFCACCRTIRHTRSPVSGLTRTFRTSSRFGICFLGRLSF